MVIAGAAALGLALAIGLSLQPIDDAPLPASAHQPSDALPVPNRQAPPLPADLQPPPTPTYPAQQTPDRQSRDASHSHQHDTAGQRWVARLPIDLSGNQPPITGDTWTLEVPDGSALTLRNRKVQTNAKSTTITGDLIGQQNGSFTIAQVGNSVAGAIHDFGAGTVISLRPTSEGAVEFHQVSSHTLGDCGICLLAEATAAPEPAEPIPLPQP